MNSPETLSAVSSMRLLAAGDRLAEGLANIRRMLYGLGLPDPRQAWLAQKAIEEAVDAQRNWNDERQKAANNDYASTANITK